MNFHLADDDTFRLSNFHPLELRFLKQATLMADPEGSPGARSRLYPDPLKRHRARKGESEAESENAEESSDWEEFVVPGLETRFQSALEVLDRDIEQMNFEEGGNADLDEIVVPVQHAEQWYLALNQARLVMAERFQLHSPPHDAFLFPDDDDEKEGGESESESESEKSARLKEEPDPPKLAILTFIQYEFYGRLQCYLMDLFL